MESVPMEPVPFLHAAHFHWRSDEQYASKVATSWLNNVTKYTVHTITASFLKGCFEKIRAHERVEPEDILKDAENFDLRPYVQGQTLRYSGTGRPDVLSNLMAAGEQVAQSYAEYKTLQKRRQLSFVVPYLGDYEAWEQALEQAMGQTYPYREILVPVLRGGDEQKLSRRLAALGQEQTHILQGKDVWGDMSAQAKGDYVQWILPGVEYCPEQAVRLISCLESQDYDFLLAVSNGRREFASWSIYYDIMDYAPITVFECKTAWRELLCLGKQPSAGLSGAMIKRKLMEECSWLRDGFLEGQPLLFAMWRILLMGGCDGREKRRLLGFVHGQYVKRDWQNIEGEAWLWHQLEWVNLLELDGTMLTLEQQGQAYQGVKHNWELLGHRVREMPGVNRRLWEQYEGLMKRLEAHG